MGFTQTSTDPCVYYLCSGGESFFLGVYVDDILLAADSKLTLDKVKQELTKRFKIKDMGKIHHFLGMKVVQDELAGQVWIGQPAYTQSMLKRFEMHNANPVATPVDVNNKLVKATEEEDPVDRQLYQSAVGGLLYLSVATRPDITYAVSNVAKFSSNPTSKHWTAVKRIMRYLKGTTDLGIVYTSQEKGDCVGFSDSDWGGDLDDRKSTSGYVFQYSGGAVSWRFRKQTCVALSTVEAEYIALANATQEALWLKRFFAELGSDQSTVIQEDNQSTISMTRNPQFHGRSKHISIKYHFVRDQVSKGTVDVKYCPSTDMIADITTKGIPKTQFTRLREMIGLRKCPGNE